MKEAKQDYCEKCGTHFYYHDHHILLKSIFGNGETKRLCPNCHTHFHEYLKNKIYRKTIWKKICFIWAKWLYTITVAAIIFVGIWWIFG